MSQTRPEAKAKDFSSRSPKKCVSFEIVSKQCFVGDFCLHETVHMFSYINISWENLQFLPSAVRGGKKRFLESTDKAKNCCWRWKINIGHSRRYKNEDSTYQIQSYMRMKGKESKSKPKWFLWRTFFYFLFNLSEALSIVIQSIKIQFWEKEMKRKILSTPITCVLIVIDSQPKYQFL